MPRVQIALSSACNAGQVRPLSLAWRDSDFVDTGHFSAAGAEKFAEAIAGDIAANFAGTPLRP